MMNHLVDWSLSAIDTIFSTRKAATEGAACPEGTFDSGAVQDSWGKYRPLCLTMLTVEDSEDIWLFSLDVAGFLIIGMMLALLHRKIDALAGIKNGPSLPTMAADTLRIGVESARKLDAIQARANGQIPRIV